MEHVAGTDLARGLGGDVVRGDAVHVAGFGGLLAGFEEASGPEPLVDACAGHESIFFYFCKCVLDGAEHAHGEIEESGDELESAADHDADETEGQEDQPDERIEEKRREGDGPTEDHEDQKEQKVEHGCFSPVEINDGGEGKVPGGWMIKVWSIGDCSGWWGWTGQAIRGQGREGRFGLGFGRVLRGG
jgi:hypothetical protein